MTTVSGILQITDLDRSFVNVVGQQVVYQAIQQYLLDHNTALQEAMSLFVGGTTEKFKYRFKLAGGGYLQLRGGQATSGAMKSYGSWDVALPLLDFGAQFGGDDITLAYMSMAELDLHMATITAQNVNTVRLEVLKALLDSTSYTFSDPINGSLSVVPLANGDSVTFPPVVGSDSEATDNHYLESNYATASISNTNNPFKTIRAELIEHFGGPQQGGENILVVINSGATSYVEALTDFVPLQDRFTAPGQDTATLLGLPRVPGRIIGRCNGCWVSEWDWLPANYAYGQHLDFTPPLEMRTDPADTGLPRGLALVATSDAHPLVSSHYRNRFGMAVVNRLNGVVMEFGTGGTYTVPTGYSH